MRALPPKIVRAFWESPWNSLFLDRQGGKAIAGTPNKDAQGLLGSPEIPFSSTGRGERPSRALPPMILRSFRGNLEIAFSSTGRGQRPSRAFPPKIPRTFRGIPGTSESLRGHPGAWRRNASVRSSPKQEQSHSTFVNNHCSFRPRSPQALWGASWPLLGET